MEFWKKSKHSAAELHSLISQHLISHLDIYIILKNSFNYLKYNNSRLAYDNVKMYLKINLKHFSGENLDSLLSLVLICTVSLSAVNLKQNCGKLAK